MTLIRPNEDDTGWVPLTLEPRWTGSLFVRRIEQVVLIRGSVGFTLLPGNIIATMDEQFRPATDTTFPIESLSHDLEVLTTGEVRLTGVLLVSLDAFGIVVAWTNE